MDPTSETDGVIPTQGAQGAQSATMDPMALVRAGLQYGRKQAGLPEQFYGGTPSFADGGMVPDPGGQSSMPDPQKAMSYISGDGAIAADIVDALENDADPDGTMDPSERTMTVFGKAGTPDGASGLLAHYRTRYNGYSGAARAALSQGDLAGAAHYATQAFASVPTGHSTRFAPAEGGLSMTTTKHGVSDQSFSQGGTVDASNPDSMSENESTDGSVDEDPSYDKGGLVTLDHDTPDDDPRYNTLPGSENIEDRRNQANEGKVYKNRHNGKFDLDGEDYNDRYVEPSTASFGETGVIRKQRAFDEGGPVDGAPIPDESDGSYGAPPPAVLQAQQVDQLLSAGFDKTLEQALGVGDVGKLDQAMDADPGGLVSGASNLFNTIKKGAAKPLTDMGQPGSPLRDAGKGEGVIQEGMPEDDIGPPVTAPVTPQPAGASDYDEYAQSGERLGQAPAVKERGPASTRAGAPTEKAKDPAAEDPEMQKYNKYLRVANQMFPWMSQSREREAYIARRMHDAETQEGKERLEGSKGEVKTNLQTQKGEQQRGLQTEKITHQDMRNHQNNLTRARIAAAHEAERRYDQAQQREAQVMRTRMGADQDYVTSDDFKAKIAALAKAAKVSTDVVYDGLIDKLQLPEGAQRPASAPGGRQEPEAPVGTRQRNSKTGQVRVMQPDGSWLVE